MNPTELPEILRLYPSPAEKVNKIYEGLKFPVESSQADDSGPYVYINVASSLDGRAAKGGKAGGIGSGTDRETMRVLRSKADAVMVGAGTLRAEVMSLTSEGRRTPEPLAVIVSGSGQIPLEEQLIGFERGRTIVIVPSSVSSERMEGLSRSAHILVARAGTRGSVDLPEAIKLLEQRFQVRRLLVEGGPSLNHALISSGQADELFLTLAPKIIGGSPGEIETIVNGGYLAEKERFHVLLSAYLSGSELFLRYRL